LLLCSLLQVPLTMALAESCVNQDAFHRGLLQLFSRLLLLLLPRLGSSGGGCRFRAWQQACSGSGICRYMYGGHQRRYGGL